MLLETHQSSGKVVEVKRNSPFLFVQNWAMKVLAEVSPLQVFS
jgi:hypothetical protein